jgi:hypothetical protein
MADIQNIKIPESSIASSSTGRITIDQIEVHDLMVKSMSLEDFKGKFTYGKSKLKNLKIRLTLRPKIDWWVGIYIDMPWPFDDIDWSWSGTIGLGEVTLPWLNLGDQDISWGSLNINSPKIVFGPLDLPIEPMKSTRIEKMAIRDIDMFETRIPTGMLALLGTSMSIANPLDPKDVSVEETMIGTMDSVNINLPSFVIPQEIMIPNIKMDDLATSNINAAGSTSKKFGQVDLGLLRLTLRIDIDSEVSIDKISITDIDGDVTLGRMAATGLTFDLGFNGIDICDLKLKQLSIPDLELEL